MARFVIVALILALSNICRAQDNNILNTRLNALEQLSQSTRPEKVHLHLDRAWYTQGDTIWFKAYTVAGQNHQLSTVSGVLYVELINDKDSILSRKILRLNPGICWGDIVLLHNYSSGIYHLRAYTNWMRNNDTYIFDRKLIIGSPGLTTNTVAKTAMQIPVVAKQNLLPAPDIQFLPEGGQLVNGIRSKVAFKVLNSFGLATNITGVVLDATNKTVVTFKTQHLGIGVFWFKPQKGIIYKAKVLSADGISFEVPLPVAKDAGFAFSLTDKSDSLRLKIAVNEGYYKGNKNIPFYIIAQSAGKAYYSATGKLVDTVINIPIARELFPSGIVQLTLFSGTGEPLNERLAFLLNHDQQKIDVALKPVYKPGEKVTLQLNTNNITLKPIQGSYSVAITDVTQTPVDEDAENTILTDLLLNGDLQGKVEKPNYYFATQSDSTRANLDLLMLTQGFRKFNWQKQAPGSTAISGFMPETELRIKGSTNLLANHPAAGAAVRLTSVKDHFVIDTTSDAAGQFVFKDLDLLDTSKVVINAFMAQGVNNLNVKIIQPEYPIVKHDGQQLTLPPIMLTVMEQAHSNMQQDSMKSVRQLAEVVIKGKKKKPHDPVYSSNMQYSSNLNGPGKANQVIMGNKLRGCPQLQQCLATTIYGVSFVPDSSGSTTPYSMRSIANHIKGRRPMAIFIDGIQMGAESLSNYSGDDVYSVEVLTSVSNLSIYGSNAPNGAIIITLKHGADGDVSTKMPRGIITYNYKGYSKVREFYSPVYSNTSPVPVTDKRKTIYWNPNIITDHAGKASFEFFNADNPATYRLVIEGIDGYGYLGRQVLNYKVQ